MVEVDREVYNFAQSILDEFDPNRKKETKLADLEAKMQKNEAQLSSAAAVMAPQSNTDRIASQVEELAAEEPTDTKPNADLSIKAKSNKWDKVVKKIDLEEEMEEAKQTDFE